MEVAHAISLLWVFELCARYHMIYFYLAGMEWFSFAFANAWQVQCTDCPFEKDDFFS